MHTVKNFRCTWLDESPPIIDTKYFKPGDHIIFTEMGISRYYDFIRENDLQFSIFVQNGYHLSTGVFDKKTKNKVKTVYNKASFIFSISNDTSDSIHTFLSIPKEKIIRMQYYRKISFNKDANNKSDLITYMPRKNYDHAHKVIFGLIDQLPKNWKIKPIIDMTDHEVDKTLNESKVFLALSNFEGLPAPPIEAAFANNFVIGYHGQGGKEYWVQPVFSEIKPLDVKSFMKTILDKVKYLDSCSTFPYKDFDSFQKEYSSLFSKESEISCLKNMHNSINDLSTNKETKPVPNLLQKSKYLLKAEDKYFGLKRRIKNSPKYWSI